MPLGVKKATYDQRKEIERKLLNELVQQDDKRWKYKPAPDGSVQNDITIGIAIGCSASAVARMRKAKHPGGFVYQIVQSRKPPTRRSEPVLTEVEQRLSRIEHVLGTMKDVIDQRLDFHLQALDRRIDTGTQPGHGA